MSLKQRIDVLEVADAVRWDRSPRPPRSPRVGSAGRPPGAVVDLSAEAVLERCQGSHRRPRASDQPTESITEPASWIEPSGLSSIGTAAPALLVLVEHLEQRLEPAGLDHRVRVQEAEVTAPRPFRPSIRAPPKPRFSSLERRSRPRPRRGAAAASRRARRCRRRPPRRRLGSLEQRLERASNERPVAVRDHDDRDERLVDRRKAGELRHPRGAAATREGPQGSREAPRVRAADRGLHVREPFGERDALVDQPLSLHLVCSAHGSISARRLATSSRSGLSSPSSSRAAASCVEAPRGRGLLELLEPLLELVAQRLQLAASPETSARCTNW